MFIVGFPPTRPTPLNTQHPGAKLTTRTLCKILYCSTLLRRGALCRVSHQPGKHPRYTRNCDSEGDRATRMALWCLVVILKYSSISFKGVFKERSERPYCRPSEHPPGQGENVQTFKWDNRCEHFMAFNYSAF